MRPDWNTYFLGIAEAVAERADCTRRKAGAVITKHHRIVSTGYNGAPSGQPGCLEGACPRGRHYATGMIWIGQNDRVEICGCGKSWPCPDQVEPGSSYDTGPGTCIGIHAEANAIIYGDYDKMSGATIYITSEPCGGCLRIIAGAGILQVIYAHKGSPMKLDWPFLSS